MSTPIPPADDSFLNSPAVISATGFIAQLQQQGFFAKERLHSLRQRFLLGVGFLVLLYCLIRIQILFFWLLKLVFRLVFKLLSIVFWLPLKAVHFFIPKTIDYDILFPLFWLCSISSFYIAKYSHENVCQLFDQHIVRRYKLINYDQIKREDVRRYLFVLAFVALLLLQTLFILLPVAQSIKHHRENAQLSSSATVVKQAVASTTTARVPTAKSSVKEAVHTMRDSLYHRFIDAFTDENETETDGKRAPLISDEKIEETFKTIQKEIQHGVKSLKPTVKKEDDEEQEKDTKRSSRFQRWIVHYLKAPFRKWEKQPAEVAKVPSAESNARIRDEEENDDENSSSSLTSSGVHQDDSDDDDEEEEDDDDSSEVDDAHLTMADRMRQQVESAKQYGARLKENLKRKISSSGDEDDEEDSDDDEEPLSSTERAQGKMADTISTLDDDDDDDDDEEESMSTMTETIKNKLKNTAQSIGQHLRDKFSSSKENASDDDDDDDDEESSSTLSDKLQKPIQAVKSTVENLQNKVLSTTTATTNEDEDDEESRVDSDNDDGDSEAETEASWIDRTKQASEELVTPVLEKLSSTTDDVLQQAHHLADSAREWASNALDESSDYVHKKTEQVKGALPDYDRVLSDIEEDVVKPMKDRATKVKKALSSKTEQIKQSAVDGVKSLKKKAKKKSKTLLDQAHEKIAGMGKTLKGKLSGQGKKKSKSRSSGKFSSRSRRNKPEKLNGQLDDAWNVWHQGDTNLAHLFSSSTKHARHSARYNITSLYAAYTDIRCFDCLKKHNRYRLLKRPYSHLLDLYRHHSPFPVYLSILKSNGPLCYRHYPDSSCGVIPKSVNRNFKTQLYRFAQLWAIIGLLIALFAAIYQRFTDQRRAPSASPRDFDRSTKEKQSLSNASASTTKVQKLSSIPSQTFSSNTTGEHYSARALDERVDTQLRLWLERERNDGFRTISESCRMAINNTFLKQLERLSVETLQFANAKILNVSQTNDASTEKLSINAVLDIDHLILSLVNTFKEQHFSLGTPKLSGQLKVLLGINPNQYSIEASFQQLQLSPFNVIDPTHALSADEKKTIVKLVDEILHRTVVRCSFRLADNQENRNDPPIHNSSFGSYPESNRTPSPSYPIASSSNPTTGYRFTQPVPNPYQPSESIPTLLVNDIHPHSYQAELLPNQQPKRLLVRIVKAVKLHDVEQPYCILELNHPTQIHRTHVAKNGLNPFWDERFLFECDETSNELRLQIVDQKTVNRKLVDLIYADVLIPFSYVTSTVYKQDVQIKPQYPESIIRIEFSTVSEEQALAVNNGCDVESITDSQTWDYNDRDTHKIDHDYAQRRQPSPSDFYSSSYDTGPLPKQYGAPPGLYQDERDFASTLPRPGGMHSTASNFSASPASVARDPRHSNNKPQKSKSFMSSLKHLTLPRRKNREKDRLHDDSISSQASSTSQLNTSMPLPANSAVSHSLSSALPGPHPEYFLPNTTDPTPMRRTRSISQSFRNLFRSSSKKKASAAKATSGGVDEFENGNHHFMADNHHYLSSSTPTTKKLSFLQRRKSKQKAKQQTNISTNSLSSYDCSRMESVRDTPIRANVGHPVTMTKSYVQ